MRRRALPSSRENASQAFSSTASSSQTSRWRPSRRLIRPCIFGDLAARHSTPSPTAQIRTSPNHGSRQTPSHSRSSLAETGWRRAMSGKAGFGAAAGGGVASASA